MCLSPSPPETRSNGRRRARRGATAVEFAITAPVFFLFLLAAFEFGWLNVIRHTADNAAYEAARHAMVPGATAAEAVQLAGQLLSTVGTRDARITVSPSRITPDTKEVTVEIDVPMNRNGLVAPRFTSTTVLHSSTTLRAERAE